jgi:hypothetical protein
MPVAIELSAEEKERFRRSHRWTAAIKASLIAGALVWIFPSGNPWTAFTRPSGAYIMGRPVTADESVTQFTAAAVPAHLAHFAVAVIYGFILLAVVYRLRSWRAFLAGGVTGLILYAINLAAFKLSAPQFTGAQEFNVAFAHFIFALVATGAIRGFLAPPKRLDKSQPNDGPQLADPSRVTSHSETSGERPA